MGMILCECSTLDIQLLKTADDYTHIMKPVYAQEFLVCRQCGLEVSVPRVLYLLWARSLSPQPINRSE